MFDYVGEVVVEFGVVGEDGGVLVDLVVLVDCCI